MPSPTRGRHFEAIGKDFGRLLMGGSKFHLSSMEPRERWLRNTISDMSTNEGQETSVRHQFVVTEQISQRGV